jgi:hypothetical protein
LAGGGSSNPGVPNRISINPGQGDPGETIAVTGTGAKPGTKVTVSLSPGAETAEGALASVELDVGKDGTFSTNLTIPEDAEDGLYAIRAEQFTENGGVLQYYWNQVVIGDGGDGPLMPNSGGVFDQAASKGVSLVALLLIGVLLLRGIFKVVAAKFETIA